MTEELRYSRKGAREELDKFTHLGSLIDSGKELNPTDLTGALEHGELTPEQFSALLSKLIANSQELTRFKKRYKTDSLANFFDRFYISPK